MRHRIPGAHRQSRRLHRLARPIPGPTFVAVAGGEGGSMYRAAASGCAPTKYATGSGFLQPSDRVYCMRNEASTPLVLHAFYFLPAGTDSAAIRVDQAQPANCPGIPVIDWAGGAVVARRSLLTTEDSVGPKQRGKGEHQRSSAGTSVSLGETGTVGPLRWFGIIALTFMVGGCIEISMRHNQQGPGRASVRKCTAPRATATAGNRSAPSGSRRGLGS